MNLTKADRDKLRETGSLYFSALGVVMLTDAYQTVRVTARELLDAMDAAERENKRLREALERIANAHDEHIHVLFHYQDEASRTGAMHVLDWAQCIAKAALAEPEAHP